MRGGREGEGEGVWLRGDCKCLLMHVYSVPSFGGRRGGKEGVVLELVAFGLGGGGLWWQVGQR